MDKVIELETFDDYAAWRWYAGALQQHHYALLMATEIIMNPRRKESSRIWKGLNYVFEPPSLPPIARARWVITQASWKMDVYLGKRQLRAPINLEQNLKEALKLSEADPHNGRHSSASTETTLVDDEQAQLAQGQSAARQPSSGHPTKKRTTSSKSMDRRGRPTSSSPISSRGSEDSQMPSSQNKASAFADQSSSKSSPALGASAKQIMDIDWVCISDNLNRGGSYLLFSR